MPGIYRATKGETNTGFIGYGFIAQMNDGEKVGLEHPLEHKWLKKNAGNYSQIFLELICYNKEKDCFEAHEFPTVVKEFALESPELLADLKCEKDIRFRTVEPLLYPVFPEKIVLPENVLPIEMASQFGWSIERIGMT